MTATVATAHAVPGIDPGSVCLFVPPFLKKFKLDLFERIAQKIGRAVHHNYDALASLSDNIVPIVGCTPELRPLIDEWQQRGRRWIYWDRGYVRRVFATWLPRGTNGGYYRWHINSYQMRAISQVPADRWAAADIKMPPWTEFGRHIVVAEPSPTYQKFHGIQGWTENTLERLKYLTDRQIITRDKECKRPLYDDVKNAHALVTHGSIAAVEAVIMGCPVFVDTSSAATLVGHTELRYIEQPMRPDRENWARSLAYCQFNEQELVDGTLWRMIT